MKLQNFLLAGLMICSFGAKADVSYAGVSFQSGDIDVDSDSFDVSAYGVNFLSTSGNILFSTSAASGATILRRLAICLAGSGRLVTAASVPVL